MEPEPNCRGPVEEWEESVFRCAVYFTVWKRYSRFDRRSVRFETYPAAIAHAQHDPSMIVYAVTERERNVPLVRARWPRYLQIWKEMERQKGSC